MVPRDREMGKLMAIGQIGLEMAAPIGLGWWLDVQFGTLPWLIIAGAVVGLVGGVAHLVVMMNKAEAEERQRQGK